MEDSDNLNTQPHRSITAGTIRRIKLENFMCHSNLEIEFGDFVNFITGQNGSGKSAILTALCVAFGSRAKATNRASTLKDFIKTGCSYALVQVVLKNEGMDAFKVESYRECIIIERRITESSSTLVLKDHQGRRVSNKKEELRELVEHFNIDVENPCVIMTQDKSREFLQSGSAKDKFKFFFKATLLQQVDDLLKAIEQALETADELVQELERSIEPVVRELNELQAKIKNTERVEELSDRVKLMKYKLAWSWVYDVDKELLKQRALVEKRKLLIPTCQAEIDQRLEKIEDLKKSYTDMKIRHERLAQKTSEVNRLQDELKDNLSMAAKSRMELMHEYDQKISDVQKMTKRVESLEQQVQNIQEQNMRNTQAEESRVQEKLKELQDEVKSANALLTRLKEDETALSESLDARTEDIRKIREQVDEHERKLRDFNSQIYELRQNQTNKVTAFGGEKVIQLLRIIESRCNDFQSPPIGPIGVHLKLTQGDLWACAVENAIGKLLNAFIVTNIKDSHLLRKCARQVHYDHLQIIIYDFSHPRYNLPDYQLPQTRHPTTLSVLHSDKATVVNVLVDKGGAERQVLVKDYDMGKTVAFEERVSNLKEVFTSDGYKMFSRGSVQTILPPNKRNRAGRLCSSYDDQIKDLEKDALYMNEQSQKARQLKRVAEEEVHDLQEKLQDIKRRRISAERNFSQKTFAVDNFKRAHAAEASGHNMSTVDELCEEIMRTQAVKQEKETMLAKVQVQMNEVQDKVRELKASLGNLLESAKEDFNALDKAVQEYEAIAKDLEELEREKRHYEKLQAEKILPEIKEAEAKYQQLEQKRKDSYEKASYMCPEDKVKAMGGCEDTPEQLSAHLKRMIEKLEQARDIYTESIDDLRKLYEKKQSKILTKQKTYENFRKQLQDAQRALESRKIKFNQNASYMMRQMTWNFNSNLGKKGISGQITVDSERKTLSLEVKMPQDASRTTVQDTRGLSGGERSFSTLCFALALHQMTESPFRAMDEFDVFMDAVSRKISLDTLVDFALAHGSQWMFITPHDISMVKQDERVKKQQMAAPRS
ncbi:structural maintenance of chromosomes protein 6B-like [Chenopodium quinoa]|uniref:structural maintenance of chromosomes protein 6B-like n=1 Tax=Chenopodium quinoa TaxID=63459 RepID=UPI000B78B056|nr:structural maintenance of chromosomes protein 6B-like [Chenopodium quinoa]